MNKVGCFDIETCSLWLSSYFFRINFCLFVKIDSWDFQHLFDFDAGFRETSQNFSSSRQPIEKNLNKSCLCELNELEFCEASQNPKSNRCWKFQLSILKNKKVLFLKKYDLSHMVRIILFLTNSCPLDGAILEWRFCLLYQLVWAILAECRQLDSRYP